MPDYHWSSATAAAIPGSIWNLYIATCYYKITNQIQNDETTEIQQSRVPMLIGENIQETKNKSQEQHTYKNTYHL